MTLCGADRDPIVTAAGEQPAFRRPSLPDSALRPS
jgi:hypothetical protein